MKTLKNSRGSVLIWTVVLAVLVELVLLYALSTFTETRANQATESRRLDVHDFATTVEAVLADKAQCEAIVVPIVNRAAATVAAGSFLDAAAGAAVAPWAQPPLPDVRRGVALLSKIGPASFVAPNVPQFIVDQTARTALQRQAAGLISVQTWRNATGSATPATPSVAADFVRRRVEPDPSISNFNYVPLSLASSGIYVTDLALIEVPPYDDVPGFPRAFEIWAQMARTSDAPAGVVPGPMRLAEIAAVTGNYLSSGTVTGCVLRSVARAAPTDDPFPNPFALSCTGNSILRTATITNPDGTTRPGATCVSPPVNPITCPPGQFLIGLEIDGRAKCTTISATSGPGEDLRTVFPPDSSCKRPHHRLASTPFYKRDDSGRYPASTADVVAFYGPDICKTWDDPGGYIFQPVSGCQYRIDADNLAGPGGGWYCSEFWCCHSY